MKKRVIIFLDIDGVMVVGYHNKKKVFPWGKHFLFDKKCVDVLNAIYDEIPFEIVISSDWRNQFEFDGLIKMFQEFKIKAPVVDITNKSIIYDSNLDRGRFHEIEEYVKKHNNEILAWVAVDDLKLYDLEHFVETPKWLEGIKQTGIKEKIIKELKTQINE